MSLVSTEPSIPNEVPKRKSPATFTTRLLSSIATGRCWCTHSGIGPNSGREESSKRIASEAVMRSRWLSTSGSGSTGSAGSKPTTKMLRVSSVTGFFHWPSPR